MYTPLARSAALALQPLADALADRESCERLLRDLGWQIPVTDSTLEQIHDLLPLLDVLQALPALVEELDSGSGSAGAIASLADATGEIVRAIEALSSLDAADLESLPGNLANPAAWADLSAALPDLLLARWLAQAAPPLFALLRLTGVCMSEPAGRTQRDRFRWELLGAALADPAAAAADTVGWRDGTFHHWWLQRELGLSLARLGLPVRIRAQQPAVAEAIAGAPVEVVSGMQSDVVLFSGETPGGALAEVGLLFACARNGEPTLYVGNLAYGELTEAIPIGAAWSLEAAGSIDGTATMGVRIQPSGLELVDGGGSLGASIALEGRPDEPWLLIGGNDGTRVELDHARLELGVEGDLDDPEAYALVRVDEGALRFVLDLGEGDAFLRDVIGEPPVIEAGFELRWGTRSGIAFSGGLGLAVTLVIERALGPLYVESLSLALAPADAGARLEATTVAALTVGPFETRVSGVGAALELQSATDGDQLAGLDAKLAFVPPTEIGLELELEGASGEGYISIDPDTGRYAGAGAFNFVEVGLAAVVVVDTQLPGDPDGWALFCSLSLTFSSIPLGFGFFLSGVGGLVAVNRTMDVEALAGGLSSGAVDAILFPEEPEESVELIVSQLDSWFPLAEGSLVFGVAGRITWGTPKTVVTADIGVVLTFPELDLAVMGNVSIELPEETDALLELHMDVIGTIDLSEGTVMVVAALHDSSLLKTLQLSGGMAMYASVGEHPYFLLSVGGYHPDFQPPAELPAAVTELDRMRVELELSENAWFALEAYFAITSNTLQFGSEATLELSDKFLGVTYTARGSVGFDVLLVFSPFSFTAGLHAGVAITAGSGDKELLAVDLSAQLEGPEPWHATGRASFDFFGLNASIDIEIGGTARVEAPQTVDLLAEVEAALRDPSAWRGSTPTGADTGAVLLTGEEAPADGEIWVRPDAELEVVQTVAPLERQLDRYGIYAIDGDSLLTITAAGLGGEQADHEPVLDWFAPAQYDDYRTNAEKLAAPSYEEMTGGVRFGTESVSVSPDAHNRTVTPDYEVKILDEDKTRDQPLGKLASPLDLVTATLALEAARRGLPARSATSTRFTIQSPSWTIADAVTGAGIAATGTYREALDGLHTTVAADPTARAAQRVAPTQAVLETA